MGRVFALATLLWSCATISGVYAATITPTPQDRQAFDLGVSQQQAINVFWEPHTCGIVLMRPYCQSAMTSLVGSPNLIPGLQTFVATGNVDAYNKKWLDANAIGFTDAAWRANTRNEWLRAAGAMYMAYYAPNWDAYSMMQIPIYRQLVQFASDASPYDTLLEPSDIKAGPSAVDVQGPVRIAKYFVPALAAVFPPAAEPELKIDPKLGDAQLGVYCSTAAEMFESPVLFLSPTSRVFLKDLAGRLGDATLGSRFINASSPEDWQAAIEAFQKAEVAAVRGLPDKRKEAFAFGGMAAQAAYNAAVLRDKNAEAEQSAILRQTSAAVPATIVAKLPQVLAASGDWHALNAAATALTLEIMH